MIIKVIEARYQEQFKIWLRFNTGDEGVVDLADVVEKYPVAAPLRDTSVFSQFYLDDWPTLAWQCGFDFSPESLYERATGKSVPWLQQQEAHIA